MANEILPNLQIELPDVGADTDNWGNILNDDLRLIDRAVQVGLVSKTLSSSDVVLTADEAAKSVILLTGTLTANVSVIVPTTPTRVYVFDNRTTGNFTVTVKTAGGTGVAVAQGEENAFYSDGVNVITTTLPAEFSSYTPAGIGAVKRSVQNRLRDMVVRADYDSDANFNSAANALTSRTNSLVRATGGNADRLLSAKLTEQISVKDFGAVGDGVTDDTAAFNAALTFLASNRINSRGLGRIYVPRGRYLCNGTITVASPLTLIFYGEGAEASQIIRTVDTGNLFSLVTYIYVEFADLGIYHQTTTDRATWTTLAFNLNGNGGGRMFCLRRVFTDKFDRVVSYGSTSNEDTNYFEGCSFFNCKTFLRVRNSQAVINKAVLCAWFGFIDVVFDISGFGYTHIDTANIVQSGTFLQLANGNAGSASQYLLTNAKFEFWNGPNANNTNGTTKVLSILDNAANVGYVQFFNSGISGGTADPAVYQFDLQGGNYSVLVDGGQWGGTQIQTRARTVQGGHNAWWVAFKNCTSSPSRTVNRIAGANGAHHCPVFFESCLGVENILLRGPGNQVAGNGKIAGIAMDRNRNTKNNNGYLALGNQTAVHSFSSFGQTTLVERITVVATLATAWQGAAIAAFADAARTIQIGATITPAGGSFSAPQAFEIMVPAGTFTSDGVYVAITNTSAGGGVEGLVFVDTLSV